LALVDRTASSTITIPANATYGTINDPIFINFVINGGSIVNDD